MKTQRVTIHTLRQMKERGEKIAMLTAYDATFARLLDEGGADVLLVGDSLGMVVQGHDTTLPVTLEEMAYHCRAVARGTTRAHVVGDMPFMSYQASIEQGMANAGRLIKEGGCHSVKLEGGAVHAELVRRLVARGHPGDGPHRPHAAVASTSSAASRSRAATAAAASGCSTDARALEEAGVYAIVLEAIPADIAREITGGVVDPDDRHRRRRRRATARCSSATTCSAWTRRSSRASCAGSRRSAQTIKDAVAQYVAEVRGGRVPVGRRVVRGQREARAREPQLVLDGRREEVVLSSPRWTRALVELARGRRVRRADRRGLLDRVRHPRLPRPPTRRRGRARRSSTASSSTSDATRAGATGRARCSAGRGSPARSPTPGIARSPRSSSAARSPA